MKSITFFGKFDCDSSISSAFDKEVLDNTVFNLSEKNGFKPV